MSLATFVDSYRRDGHATLVDVFPPSAMDRAITDAMQWVAEIIPTLEATDRQKVVEVIGQSVDLPRWIDHPVLKRPRFRELGIR